MKRLEGSRRWFLQTLAATGSVLAAPSSAEPQSRQSIDRRALVGRHDPVLRKLDPLSPLSLGNGEFAFTADLTGLQTFADEYQKTTPLCTLAQWGWHTTPFAGGGNSTELRLEQFETHGRQVGYAVSSEGQNALYNWLRENPHRLHLGRIGLSCKTNDGRQFESRDVTRIEQRLDLWSGRLISHFELEGKPISVTTSVHPKLDLLAVAIESPLVRDGRLAARIAFPYGSSSMQAADWQATDRHRSELGRRTVRGADIERTLDEDRYVVSLRWETPAALAAESAHQFVIQSRNGVSRLAFVVLFAPEPRTIEIPGVARTFAESAAHWSRFWTEGGVIELSQSSDHRAEELERRIVLSQYLTAIQCSGTTPPQETGLTVNSWYGKFHLEMHWWHAAHFALWSRLPLLERSLGWYEKVLRSARERAGRQGYAGARWPKMVGPEGRDSPSPIGPLLIWQQAHPIFYAELCYQAHRDRRTLERYRSIVFESAQFMASFAFFEEKTRRYVLGPPVIPAQENHPPRETWNPTFELAYWSWGLDVAQRWRERLGMKRDSTWDGVLSRLSPLPTRDGVYLAHENCPQTFSERNHDHPSMLAALGMLPGGGVDRETMRRTLIKTLREWQWDKTWGWDYPMTAMTAARLGESRLAVDALLMPTEKNRYLANGHNWQRENLPCYLPGNGGLLYAVAIMAAGWSGAPKTSTPGFPDDGTWKVRWEKLSPSRI